MSKPVYQLKAEFFKTWRTRLGSAYWNCSASASTRWPRCCRRSGSRRANLSQQLAVLRRAGLVVARKEGSTVHYSLTSPEVAELLAVARRILTSVLAGQVELLEDLQSSRPRVTVSTARRR